MVLYVYYWYLFILRYRFFHGRFISSIIMDRINKQEKEEAESS